MQPSPIVSLGVFKPVESEGTRVTLRTPRQALYREFFTLFEV